MCGRLGYVGSTACQSTTVMLKNVHFQVLQRIFFGLSCLTRLCFAFCFGMVQYWIIPPIVSLGMWKERERGRCRRVESQQLYTETATAGG